MEDLPIQEGMAGVLHEFTYEAETRPMVSLDPFVLDRMQDASIQEREISDPVYGLDESTGSVTAIFQVWAATAALAVALGGWLFFNVLVRSGVDMTQDTIEMISVAKTGNVKIHTIDIADLLGERKTG